MEELEHKIEESDKAMEKKMALKNTKVEMQKLVLLTEIADQLLEKLEMEVTSSIIEEDILDEEAVIEDLADTIEVDLSDDDMDIEDDLEFEQDREMSDNS